jgi:hypothetical protein
MPAGSCCGQTIAPTAPIATKTPRRGAPTECEPTVTCEGYCYEVFLAPPEASKPVFGNVRGLAGLTGQLGGELIERIKCCLQQLMAVIPQVPATIDPNQDQVAWSNFCCNLRQGLIQFTLTHAEVDCQALAKLQATVCPSPNLDPQTFLQEIVLALERMLLITLEFFLECFCSALLPPCPAPGDPRVPLAAVTVRVSDCGIVSICDWTPLRKHVVTLKTLGYWLGWLPFVPIIRTFLEDLCCHTFGLPEQLGVFRGPQERVAAEARSGDGTGFDKPITLGSQAYTADNPVSDAFIANLVRPSPGLTVGHLAAAVFQPVDGGDLKALTASPHARVLAEVVRPVIASFAPLVQAAVSGGVFRPPGQAQPSGDEAAGLRSEIESLRATLAEHQAALDQLRRPRRPRR